MIIKITTITIQNNIYIYTLCHWVFKIHKHNFPSLPRELNFWQTMCPAAWIDRTFGELVHALATRQQIGPVGWDGGCSTASVGSVRMPISSECETSSDLVGCFGTWATCVGTTGCLLFVALSFFFPAQARWHCRMATANDKSNILNMRWVSGSLCRSAID